MLVHRLVLPFVEASLHPFANQVNTSYPDSVDASPNLGLHLLACALSELDGNLLC